MTAAAGASDAAAAAGGGSGVVLSQQGLASSAAVISSSNAAAAGQPLLQATQSAPLARMRSHIGRCAGATQAACMRNCTYVPLSCKPLALK
jgi:hypothetical protein